MWTFDEAQAWLSEILGAGKKPHLLLGNGFSMAYDSGIFSYAALADAAEAEGRLPSSAQQLMEVLGTRDFEGVLRRLESTADTLEALDPATHASLVEHLRDDIVVLREALADSIAGLHPDRPYDIPDEAYVRVRAFLDAHSTIYSVNYDLLLYWALMQDSGPLRDRRSDDGFRDSGVSGDETVLWDIYDQHRQNVYYLHGALHLFLGDDGLRKLTYSRTALPLIDQVRGQLELRRYPLYVAEGESSAKLDRINKSAYLSRGLRSLSACGGSLLVFGHSVDPNDEHVFEAVIRSKFTRMAISLYGDPASEANVEIKRRIAALVAKREARPGGAALEVRYFDAESVPLWRV